MVAEVDFSNAFAADGIVPGKYGLRTVVEYRSTLYTVPGCSEDSPSRPLGDGMDIVTCGATPQPHELGKAQRDTEGNLIPPDPAEPDVALRALSQVLDMPGMGSLDPRFLGTLRLDRPMHLKGKVRTLVIEQATDLASSNWLEASAKAVRGWFASAKPARETQPALMSWHGAEALVAVATGARLDRIFAFNFNTGMWETSGDAIPGLAGTRCIAFRPFSGRFLAVGCDAGVALLRGPDLTLLHAPGHTQVVSLDWSADGSQLATASATDGSVRLWNVGTRESMYVDKGGMARFSRGGARRLLFVASATGSFFRLWCCETWRCERWGYLSGPVTAATWSLDGMTLLFSTQGESAIHVISIGGADADEETRVVHTELTGLPREGPGGTPIMLELDSTGERLAVAYEVPESEDPSDEGFRIEEDLDEHRRFAVALYATQLQPNFRISPIGYVSGPPKSGPPVAVKFKPKDDISKSTILSCFWRSGEVSFTQLLFNPMR